MIVYREKQEFDYNTYIDKIGSSYLLEVQKQVLKHHILEDIENLIKQLMQLKKHLQDNSNFLDLFNLDSIKLDAISSNAIGNYVDCNGLNEKESEGNAVYTTDASVVISKHQKMNLDLIKLFHDAILPSQMSGWRYDNGVSQIIQEHYAPNGTFLKQGVDNWFAIYSGESEFAKINPLINYSFQHIYFETLRPFDDGNGRIGRMLNLFFFKNQKLDIFQGIYIPISVIFLKNRKTYFELLANTRITKTIGSKLTNEDLQISIKQDSKFCIFMLTCLYHELKTIYNELVLKLEKQHTF